MTMRSIPQTFYFLHIPKTAGTTLNFSVFPQVFNADEICPAYSYRQLLRFEPADLTRFRLFRGHFYYPLHRLLPEKPIYMTFLRDPFERVLSLYDYVSREVKHYQHGLVKSLKGGIRDFVQSPTLLVPNFQVIALSRDIDVAGAILNARTSGAGEIDEDQVVINALTQCPVNNDDLLAARRHLEEFPFVGITECFDAAVGLLCRTFGWSQIPSYETLNVAPASRVRREDLPAEVAKEILRSHEAEFELYEFARSLFFQRLSNMKLSA